MTVTFAVLLGIAGLVIGSFLNVCIYRIPIKKSIAYPPSACASCGHPLGFLDLFPVFSYIFLGAKVQVLRQKDLFYLSCRGTFNRHIIRIAFFKAFAYRFFALSCSSPVRF